MRLAATLIVVSTLVALAGCANIGQRQAARGPAPAAVPAHPPLTGGGYYKDDGPGENPPADLAGIPDAVPRAEPPHRFANRPYTVMGQSYTPLPVDIAYRERGLASWYGRRYHGRPTSSGEIYDMYGMTAAHATLPIPSYVRVTNPANGRSVVLRVNDRGPFHPERIIDLSYTAAWKLDLLRGVGMVEVERILPEAGGPDTRLASAPVREPAPPARRDPAPAAAPSPAQPPVAGIYLQLGAFANAAAAEALVARLRDTPALGLPGVHRLEADGLTRVQAGPYLSLAAADLAAASLLRDLGIRPFRVSR